MPSYQLHDSVPINQECWTVYFRKRKGNGARQTCLNWNLGSTTYLYQMFLVCKMEICAYCPRWIQEHIMPDKQYNCPTVNAHRWPWEVGGPQKFDQNCLVLCYMGIFIPSFSPKLAKHLPCRWDSPADSEVKLGMQKNY